MDMTRTGRKSLTGGDGVSPMVRLRFPSDMLRAAKAEAKKNGESLSGFIRRIVSERLKACKGRG